jgi:hypothetical protein
LIVLLVKPAQAGEGDIPLQISISPNAGEIGTIVTVTGSGAEPGRTVRIVLADRPNPPSDIYETVEFSSQSDGTFAVSLTIPTELTNGTYYVRVEQTRAGGVTPFYYYNRFQVGPAGDNAMLPTTGTNLEATLIVPIALGLVVLLSVLSSGVWAVWRDERES